MRLEDFENGLQHVRGNERSSPTRMKPSTAVSSAVVNDVPHSAASMNRIEASCIVHEERCKTERAFELRWAINGAKSF